MESADWKICSSVELNQWFAMETDDGQHVTL